MTEDRGSRTGGRGSGYAELDCHSAFSFLDGSSLPEEIAGRAAEIGCAAVALTDFGGVYGAPRLHKAARQAGIRAIVGAQIGIGEPDSEGGNRMATRHPPPATGASRVTLLCRTREGYRNLCRLLTLGHADLPKGECAVTLDQVERHAAGLIAVAPPSALLLPPSACLSRLASIFPRGDLLLSIRRHFSRAGERANRAAIDLARSMRLPVVAVNGVRYATAQRAALYDVMTCIRLGVTLDAAGRRLLADAERRLKSPGEMADLFRDVPEAVENAAATAARCGFTLEDLGYAFPEFPMAPGRTADDLLRELTLAGARGRYGHAGGRPRAQIEKELAVIAKLGLAGYFLVVHDIARFCRDEGILAQGRGSAANSAVCYALGITAVDPVGMDLLFERFLSEERGEWPDIDIDLPSGERRESVIRYVYRRYGERGAAMTANVITYRGRSAVRDVGKALGLPAGALDAVAKLFHGWGPFPVVVGEEMAERVRDAGLSGHPRAGLLVDLAVQIQNLPRHLGQHSGGMVIAAGRLDDVVPLEPASMPGRTVIQWDKDDCSDLGIIKVDLLGLGMLAALEEAVPLVRRHYGVEIDLAHLPPDDPDTYGMLRRADTVGVFQVESRAQMATLPRMRPERFYDLVVEVAIIRPGPIAGRMVSPYLRRRAGREPVTYPHPSLEPILRRTLGVPIFQEQLMRVAMVAAGFTGGEAEELRRAMGFKRSVERMASIERRLREGMARNGIAGAAADEIVRGITSFAMYGFPESHAASFALIAYASAYLKAHHPAAFACALLNAWPMGFYHPATIVKDLQHHGVRVLPVDVARSAWRCTLEEPTRNANSEQRTAKSLRLGLRFVRGLREEAGGRIVAERGRAPFSSIADLVRRCDLRSSEIDTLAGIGALGAFGPGRREAIWQVARLGRGDGPLWDGDEDTAYDVRRTTYDVRRTTAAVPPCPLPPMSPIDRVRSDYEGVGMTTGPHPVSFHRLDLLRRGVSRASDLASLPDGRWVKVGGLVVVRQRPGTAKGFFFLTLEDETGLANAVVTPQRYEIDRTLLVTAPALVVEGPLQRRDGVTTVKAVRFRTLGARGPGALAHDFR